MATETNEKTVKRTFWGAAVFYFLIAFEFFYMASPFAVYFYSVYRPVLDFFNQSPKLAWLVRFFMPHVTETSSAIIDMHNIAGALLAVLGFLAFCVGAGQVYYHKLTQKGVVIGGIYNLIRHPQYASLIICSFGLLLIWPRYIVLIMFITMLFAYYLLARAEERECEAKFGQSYLDYKTNTGLFLPIKTKVLGNLTSLPKSKLSKSLTLLLLYIFTLSAGIGIAIGLDSLTLNSLYGFYTSDTVYISVSKIDQDKLENIVKIVSTNKEVNIRLEKAGNTSKTKFLNYVLPGEWYVPEIPMNGINGVVSHSNPVNYDRNMYKVIFNKAHIRANKEVSGKDIISSVAKREPVVEVWIDVADQKVVKILEMPEKIRYENIPVAIY